MNKNQKLCECRHCGNKGNLNILVKDTIYETSDSGEVLFSIPRWLLKCPVCECLTIIDYFEPTDEEEILYPALTITQNGVPKKIYTAFCSAEKTQHIDLNICAISLRRTLELICIDKGAKEGNLIKMIEELAELNIFPHNIKEIATLIRKIGNDGTHNEIDFSKWEIKRLLKLVSGIINYLYIIPTELKWFNDELKNKS